MTRYGVAAAKRKLKKSRAASKKEKFQQWLAMENRLDELLAIMKADIRSVTLEAKIDAIEEMYRLLGKADDPAIVERLKRLRRGGCKAAEELARHANPPKLLH